MSAIFITGEFGNLQLVHSREEAPYTESKALLLLIGLVFISSQSVLLPTNTPACPICSIVTSVQRVVCYGYSRRYTYGGNIRTCRGRPTIGASPFCGWTWG